MSFPTYLFFIVYYILLSCLAEIYFITRVNERQEKASLYRRLHEYERSNNRELEHRTRSFKVINIQLIAVVIFTLAVFIAVTIFVFVFNEHLEVFISILRYVFADLYCVISIGFCIFGWLIFAQSRRLVKSLPLGLDNEEESTLQLKKLKSQRILLVNSIATLVFFCIILVRTILIMIQTYDVSPHSIHSEHLSTWTIYLGYYIAFEVIPLGLTLYLFTVIPGKSKTKKDYDIQAFY